MYNKDPQNAPAFIVSTIYDDLIWNKEIALVRSEVPNPLVLTVQTGKDIMKEFIKNYLDDNLYENYIFKFNQTPNEFNLDEYLNRFECVKLAKENS